MDPGRSLPCSQPSSFCTKWIQCTPAVHTAMRPPLTL